MEGNSKSEGKKTQRKGSEIQSFSFRQSKHFNGLNHESRNSCSFRAPPVLSLARTRPRNRHLSMGLLFIARNCRDFSQAAAPEFFQVSNGFYPPLLVEGLLGFLILASQSPGFHAGGDVADLARHAPKERRSFHPDVGVLVPTIEPPSRRCSIVSPLWRLDAIVIQGQRPSGHIWRAVHRFRMAMERRRVGREYYRRDWRLAGPISLSACRLGSKVRENRQTPLSNPCSGK